MTIIIDSTTYAIPVLSIKRTAEFLDKYIEKMETGELARELVGVYFNYRLVFGKTDDTEEYAALWAKLTEAVESHVVSVPCEDGEYTFTAYLNDVSDEAGRLGVGSTKKNFWMNLTVNFIAQEPANTP
jgi:hypothetical protein